MNGGLISARYAKALFEFAKKNRQTENVYREALLFTQMQLKHKQIRAALANPALSKTDKRKLLLLAAGGDTVSVSYEKFVNLLMYNERETFMFAILHKYIDLYRCEKNIHTARLTTATPLDKKASEKVLSLVQQTVGGIFETENTLDNGIIGGFVLEIDNNRWNASIAAQLQKIRKEFLEKNY